MNSWVVPVEDNRKHKVMYNVDEFRSINVLDATFVRGARHKHVLVGFPRLDLKDCQPVILYDGTQERCDELFEKLMEHIHNKVRVICLINDIQRPTDCVDYSNL